MKKIYSNENNFIVHNVKNLVEGYGIDVFMKNEFVQGAIGEVPSIAAWPELWVVDDNDFDKARDIVNAAQHNANTVDWICNHCAEANDASFDVCWNCQHEND